MTIISFLRLSRIIVLSLCAVVMLGACGIKGALYLPEETISPDSAARNAGVPETSEKSETR
ncbi:MAG: lipoprotein [Burkholderiales bacterium]|nr:lipoprotein [Burkholderiales bacterium]